MTAVMYEVRSKGLRNAECRWKGPFFYPALLGVSLFTNNINLIPIVSLVIFEIVLDKQVI